MKINSYNSSLFITLIFVHPSRQTCSVHNCVVDRYLICVMFLLSIFLQKQTHLYDALRKQSLYQKNNKYENIRKNFSLALIANEGKYIS